MKENSEKLPCFHSLMLNSLLRECLQHKREKICYHKAYLCCVVEFVQTAWQILILCMFHLFRKEKKYYFRNRTQDGRMTKTRS